MMKLSNIFFGFKKWEFYVILIAALLIGVLVHFRYDVDAGKEYITQAKDITEEVGEIKDVNLMDIKSAYKQPENIPYDKYRYLVYGADRNAIVTILIIYTDSSKENIKTIELVDLRLKYE